MSGRFDEQVAASRETLAETLPLVGETGSATAFPVAFLGPRMGAAVEAIRRRAFVPASTAAQSALSAASLALQAHFDVMLPTGQSRPISLFFVTVATTGARKSTSDDLAMEPIAVFQRELEEKRVEQEGRSIAQKAAYAISKAETIKNFKNKGREALEAALEGLGPEPAAAMASTIKTRVGTTEGLIGAFQIGRPSLGLMSDEGGSWLGGYSMGDEQRLNTIATLSDLWDGKPIQRLTKGDGAVLLYTRRLTFHLMIQPVLAGKLLGDAEMKGQGFLSRLLVTEPENLAGTRIVDPDAYNDPADDAAIRLYEDRLSEIIRAKLPFNEEKNRLEPRCLGMTREAQRMWWAFYNENERRVGPGGDFEDVQGFVGKLPEQAARIAAVLAAFEEGTRLEAIDAERLARGIAIAEYYLGEACRLFGVSPVNQTLAVAHSLSNWLRDKHDENLIDPSTMKNFGPRALKRLSADDFAAVIETLIRHDHLSPPLSEGGMVKGQRRRKVYRVLVRRGE